MIDRAVRLHIQPGAARTEVVGRHGDAIKIRLKAPPVDGKANRELSQFLSARLRVPQGAVTVVAGAGQRRKRVTVDGLTAAEIASVLLTPPS